MSFGTQQETAVEEEEEDIVMETRDVNVRFDMSRGQSRVLNDVSMNIYREEIFAVVGESGSGKSMFAAALLDAVESPGLTTGELTYYPRDEDEDEIEVLSLTDQQLRQFRWEEVSMVFQGAMNSFNPTMKIRAHFEETITAHDAVLEERMDYVRRLFDALNLDPDRVFPSYPHELSGGMKQRALIALSLVLEPEVLVMDEPTSALDLLMQRTIINMLTDLRDALDLTIVFITHDLPLVAGLADRIGVLYGFEFIEVGPTKPLLEDAAHPYTRALLRSVPSIDSPIDEMQTIPGSSPDPVNIPTGCSYHPRCPLADDRCEIEDPDLVQVDEDHEVSCFYWEQSENEIEYTLHEGGGSKEDL
ncbi:MAG: ABC transporter ATP-binding protein [Haloarculaceae archaeon]